MEFELEHYSIAIRPRKNKLLFEGDMSPFEEIEFPFSDRYWAADPFIVEDNGITYLFYEYFDNVEQKGKLAYSTLIGNKASKPYIILDKEYHLSFPNIFRLENNYYMIPETGGNHSIEMYKAVDFPNKWELYKVLKDNIDACDTVVLNKNGKIFLITSEMDSELSDHPWCYVKNRLFQMNNQCDIQEIEGDMAIGDYGIRNGGNIIELDELIRVGQDCTDSIYGKGIVFWKMSEKLEDIELKKNITYKEMEKIVKWHDVNHTKLKGTHTYNISEHYEVIDTSEDRKYNYAFKYINKIRRKIIKIFK